MSVRQACELRESTVAGSKDSEYTSAILKRLKSYRICAPNAMHCWTPSREKAETTIGDTHEEIFAWIPCLLDACVSIP